jgi:CRISPR-associated protein Csb1
MSDTKKLTLPDVQMAVSGTAAAFRCVTEYQPTGGPGDKVFPPTYEGGKYATERRRLPGYAEPVDCVLLDSVQSQANRMELALLEAWQRGQIALPVITVNFSGNDLPKVLRISSLEAPHRIADALLRASLLQGQPFRRSAIGQRLDEVDARNATALFELCPTALLFGLWDSTGPKGGLGAKFQRTLTSELIGYNAIIGVKTSSRIDPSAIQKNAGPLFRMADGGFTPNPTEAITTKSGSKILFAKNKQGKDVFYDPARDKDKLPTEGRPSTANLGNVTPTIDSGGVTISKAVQTTVLSLPALRRLSFPIKDKSNSIVDDAARTALAALGLCAATLTREQGCDLRSRCQLHPTAPLIWDLLDKPGDAATTFTLAREDAISMFAEAVDRAKRTGLPWMEKELVLQPSPQLVELVRRSQELAVETVSTEETD